MYPAPTMTAVAGRGLLQGLHDGEGVAHRVQQVHPLGGAQGTRTRQAADGGPDRDRAGTDDQLVVAEQILLAAGGGDQELAAGHVDAPGSGIQPQPHSRCFQVGEAAVGQVAPVSDLTGEVVGDAADGEIGVGVLQDHRDISDRVQLAGPQRGADPRVAAADHDQVHGRLPCGWLLGGLVVARRPGRRGGAIVGGPGGHRFGLVLLVGHDDVGGLGWGDGGVQRLDGHQGQQAADDLGGDKRRRR